MVSKVRPHDEHSHDLDSTAEDTPLLKSFPEPLGSASPSHAKHLQSYVLTIMILFIFVVDFAIFLQTAPRTRVIESIICNNFYREHDPSQIGDKGVVDERLCKIDPVQGELAMLAGWGDFFDNLPGMAFASPYLSPRVDCISLRAVPRNSFRDLGRSLRKEMAASTEQCFYIP